MNHDFRHKAALFLANKPDSQQKLFLLFTMKVIIKDKAALFAIMSHDFRHKPALLFHNGNKMLILTLIY